MVGIHADLILVPRIHPHDHGIERLAVAVPGRSFAPERADHSPQQALRVHAPSGARLEPIEEEWDL